MIRRDFLKNSLLSLPVISAVAPEPIQSNKPTKPIIISTWNFGRAANAEGWKVLAANGRESGYVQAEKAVRRMKDQVWVLTGNVEVIQEGGDALYTDAMEWDRMKQEFRSESEVRIIDKGEEVRGKGFTAKEDLSQYTIFAVSGHFEGDDQNTE